MTAFNKLTAFIEGILQHFPLRLLRERHKFRCLPRRMGLMKLRGLSSLIQKLLLSVWL
jgi:hypothetical protein